MKNDYNSGSSEMVRTELFAEAFAKFQESPLTGSHIELDNGMYPHNVFLEALMSCGIAGFMYIAIFLRASASAWVALRNRQISWVSLLFFLSLSLNTVSGSVWGADALATITMFFIGLSGRRPTPS
jgi:O-antigen ligase